MSEPTDDISGADQLSPQQLEGINKLATGMTQVAAAEAVGVHRVTVSNWIRKDPRFRAELNRRLQERAEATAVRLRNLVEGAVDVFEESIKRDRDPKAAGQVLKLVGARGFLEMLKPGPATFEEAALQIALEEERRSRALRLVMAATEPPNPGQALVDLLTNVGEAATAPPQKPEAAPRTHEGGAGPHRQKSSET
jgi:hypothetical protein